MVDLTRPQDRIQLTYGQYNEKQPSFSADGSTLFFSSDRGGVFNIYAMDLNSGEVTRYTDMLHGAFFPLEIPGNQLMFSGYGDGSYELYTMDLKQKVELKEREIADIKKLFQEERLELVEEIRRLSEGVDALEPE